MKQEEKKTKGCACYGSNSIHFCVCVSLYSERSIAYPKYIKSPKINKKFNQQKQNL